HGGDLGVAKDLINSAAKTGCDAVKFQTYITEKRTPADSPIFDILKQCELPFEAFAELKEYASDLDMDFFSTPFDDESLHYLEEIGSDMYKIASFDLPNHSFLRTIAKTAKSVILSTGMSNLEEIKVAFDIIKEETKKITLLHCISAYPTKEDDANLGAIHQLINNFDCVIGQSDHTEGIAVPLYAIAAGAQVLEKHFMIDENMDCVDKAVSITEVQMRELVTEARHLEVIMGKGDVELTKAQEEFTWLRRMDT
ncbi:MAG: N-acetylneuraminate synthase family protein, partial [Bacteroidetes bacterium]|nr:N-acetylneuraminate synthase family protein [Bacteroidota bacterium]